jgi:hypothetical protein
MFLHYFCFQKCFFHFLRATFVKILILNKNFEIKKTFEPICDFYYNIILPCSLHYEKNINFSIKFLTTLTIFQKKLIK